VSVHEPEQRDGSAPGEREVVRFLRLLTTAVRGVRGLGHVHCPLADDDDRVTALRPLFDARIELRRREGFGPEQRWHLPEYGATEWVRI
jgi:hypothetical protein